MDDRVSPSLVEVVLLAVWLGAAAFFSAAVAPALFAVLPARSLAGDVVGRLLPIIFFSGIIVGVAVLIAELVGARSWVWGARSVAALVMVAACAVAQAVVAPRIGRLRVEIGGPID